MNNAAVDAGSELTDISLDDWDRVLRVNLTGQFLRAREAARECRRIMLQNEGILKTGHPAPRILRLQEAKLRPTPSQWLTTRLHAHPRGRMGDKAH